MKIQFFLFIFFLLYGYPILSKEADEDNENITLKEGNFALRTSQQPGPLISFGENIINKGQTQFWLYADYFKKKDGYASDIFPQLLYQMTDELSVSFYTPFSPRNKEQHHRSKGVEDFVIQFEYAYWQKQKRTFTDQATLVGSLIYPTGSVRKNPTTGTGAMSYFFGATYNHTTIKWLYFVSSGFTLTTKHDGTKMGNQFYYQGGIGKNIAASKNWIFDWLIEFDGQYNWKDIIKQRKDKSSGGNEIFLTPSLWLSNNKMIFQLGVGFPIIQEHSIKFSSKDNFLLVGSFAWTFD